ncbi:hypothetical protein JaAD80_28640 [Janthinobacterium sp. AD80]|nr:hypothetical protein JaAD80_28640 [Janthinobacterium sp. AD80]
MRRVLHAAQHERGVQGRDEMAGQRKARAGRERIAVAVPAQHFGAGLARFHAQLRQGLGGGHRRVAAGKFIAFSLAARGRVTAFERGVRRDEIVVVDGHLLQRDAVLAGEARHRVERALHARVGPEAGLGSAWAIGEMGGRVGQHHGVAAAAESEKVADARLFHQARDEIEGRLVVLHAVFAHGIGARQLGIEFHAKAGQHGLDDGVHALVREDLAVAREGQQPQGRRQFRLVGGEIAVLPALDKARNDAAHIARWPVRQRDGHRHVLADHGGGAQTGAGRAHVQAEAEQLGQALAARHAVEQQVVGAQRRGHAQQACLLETGLHAAPRTGLSRKL